MGKNGLPLVEVGVPALVAIAGLGILGAWTRSYFAPVDVKPRPLGKVERPGKPLVNKAAPSKDSTLTGPASAVGTQPPAPATTTSSNAAVPALPGSWPGFRGASRDNVAPAEVKVPAGVQGLGMLWKIPLGEGHAGPAIHNGRVYVIDYDAVEQQDALRCFSLTDGSELWRNSYPVAIKTNHGMSRTVPVTDGKIVVSIGPMGHVLAADALTGKTLWKKDLVAEYGATIPQWYAGQCPLLDGDKVILATGGPQLLMAVDARSGKDLWKSPNPDGWKMTHSSVASVTLGGVKQYAYCGDGGIAGISLDGRLLWSSDAWIGSMATVPTPVPVGDDRLFLTSGYGAGAMMLQVKANAPKVLWKVEDDVFGSHQHTPVFYKGYLYGVEPGGEMVCLGLDGKRVWSSGSQGRYGKGPYMVADGKILVLSETGVLSILAASPDGFKSYGKLKILKCHEAWAPLAIAGNRLLARDPENMVCIQLGG